MLHDRAPSLKPTPFGLERAAWHANRLGKLPGAPADSGNDVVLLSATG